MAGEGPKDVTEIEGVFGIAMEIWAHLKPRPHNSVDHRPIAEDRKVETVTVEGNELGAELPDLGDERPYEVGL